MKNIYNSIELINEVLRIEDFKLKEKEAILIIDYMEGHDYGIKSDNKSLYVVDIQDKTDIEKESIKNIVNRVLEWNESLKEDVEFEELDEKLLKLESNEKILSALYEILIRFSN